MKTTVSDLKATAEMEMATATYQKLCDLENELLEIKNGCDKENLDVCLDCEFDDAYYNCSIPILIEKILGDKK